MAHPLFSTYLYRQPRSPHFFFRIRIPKWLRRVVRSRELRYTLKTADLTDAKYRAMRLAKTAKTLFARMRKGEFMGEMTKETIDRLMQEELNRLLEEAEADRAATVVPWTRERLENQEFGLWYLEGEAREMLALNDYNEISSHVDELLVAYGIEGVEKGGETYGTLCRELLKVHIRFLEVEQRRLTGDYTDDLGKETSMKKASQDGPAILSEVSRLPDSGERLSQIIEKFAEERKRAGVWKPKSEVEVMTSLHLLLEVLGDVQVAAISNVTMRHFKETLLRLPSNLRKNPAYRDKSIKEVLAAGVTKHMNPSTINKQLDRASSLFKWAVRNGYMDRNPAEGLQLPTSKRADEYRAAFDSDDLKKIFHSRDYLEDTHKYGYRFWLPVIALFTGMRLNEICQLHLEDIHEADEGVYVFDVRERKGVTDTKTSSSERLVPLHNFLRVDLNLPDYVAKLRSEGQTRLFPELKKRRDGYGQAASRWFSRYKEHCGIVEGPGGKKDFHSFRHTVSNKLKQVSAEHFPTQELLGHSTGSITFGRYGKRYSPKLLKEQVVDRLVYDIDLSHLKKSRFVVNSK